MKLTITKVAKYDKSRDGVPFVNKNGKPYTSMRLLTVEKPKDWISGFETAENRLWKEGDVVEVDVEQKGQYWNFNMPKKNVAGALDPQVVHGLNFKLDQIYKLLYQLAQKQNIVTEPLDDYPDGPEPEDIPF